MAKKIPKYVVKADTFNGLNIYVPEDSRDATDTSEVREKCTSPSHDTISESVVTKVAKLKLD